MICPKCSFVGESLDECPHCGIVFRSYEKHLHHPRESVSVITATSNEEDEDPEHISFHNFKINALALPIAFTLVWLCKALWFSNLIFWYFFSIPTHEMGHAIAAWLGSRVAIPIGVFIPMAAFTATGKPHSSFVFLMMLALSGGFGYLGLISKRYFGVILSLGILLNLLYWTFIADQTRADMFFIFGGVGGEFALGSLSVVAFYYQMPPLFRWDFFRFPFLITGSYTFYSAFSKWYEIAHHHANLPLGSFLQGSGDAGGDIDRLIVTYHWSATELTQTYYHLGLICLGVIGLHYAIFLILGTKSGLKR